MKMEEEEEKKRERGGGMNKMEKKKLWRIRRMRKVGGGREVKE
jgi:hypothetical protein